MVAAEQPQRVRGSAVLFGVETLAYAMFRLPTDLGFDANAFGDRGDFLSISYLVAHGSRPAIDFGYHWGLVPIMLARFWFALFGATVQANEAIMVVCALLVAIGIARMAAALRLGTLGIVLLVVALPFAFPTFTLTYALEAALLSNALAEQAAQRRSTALALATAACFVNPSMAYLYGFVLLLGLLWESRRPHDNDVSADNAADASIDWSNVFRTITPAAITGALLIVILSAVYGPLALAKTILPLAGMAAHRNQASGFFHGVGRDFWYQPRLGLPYYLFSVVGFWIAATLWLIVAGLRAGRKLLSAPRAREIFRAADEFILTCAILHVTFVTVFFGSEVSWRYYCYILVMGVAATSIRDPQSARLAGLLAVMALLGNVSHFAQIAGSVAHHGAESGYGRDVGVVRGSAGVGTGAARDRRPSRAAADRDGMRAAAVSPLRAAIRQSFHSGRVDAGPARAADAADRWRAADRRGDKLRLRQHAGMVARYPARARRP